MHASLLAAATSDPGVVIFAAALVGGAIGFFGAALMASKTLKSSRLDHWREGYAASNRDHAARRQSTGL